MIRCPSTRFRNLLVGAAALATAIGCSADMPEETGGAISDGSLVGELTAYMADYENRSELVHKLLEASGTERTLVFPTETDLTPGTRLKVWAAEEGDTLRVIRYEVLPDGLELQQQALVDATPKPIRRWAFVLVNFGMGVNVTEAQIRPRLFDPMLPSSIRSYFREVSYGIQDLEGEVFSLTTTAASACDTGVSNRLRAMIPGQFTQYLWYFGNRQMGCGWAGLAQVGSAVRPSPNSWYNASNGCVVLVQEPGHNYGMQHSSSLRCTRNGAGVPLTLPDEAGATCAHTEYGNPYDPMGRGNCYHMNGPQKAYQDWLSGCNVVKVGSSGTFTLFPLEKACNGVQLLQIPLPAPRTYRFGTISTVVTSYYLELRTPVGLDFRAQAAGNLTPRVFVHVSGDVRGANQSGSRNWMLDMTPETMPVTDGALPVGREYADPAADGPKFTVVSADMEKAIIRVTLASGGGTPEAPGTGTCDNMMPFTAPGVETCNAAPPNATPATDAGAPPPRAPDAAPAPPAMADAGAPSGIDNPLPGPGPLPPGAPGTAGTGDGGSTAPPATAEPEIISAGCGCRIVPEQSGGGALAFAGLLAFALLVRRRRR